MTTNIGPENPKPEAGTNQTAREKRGRAELALICIITSLPVLFLIAVVCWNYLSANAWSAVFSGFLVLCTIAQALIAYLQRETMVEQMGITRNQLALTEGELEQTRIAASAAMKSADIAERAMKITERAYLQVGKLTWIVFGAGVAPVCNFEIANSGRTPAKTKESICQLKLTAGDAPECISGSQEGQGFLGVSMISHGQPLGCRVTFHSPLTDDQMELVKSGDLNAFICIRLTYVDVFGEVWIDSFYRKYVTDSALHPDPSSPFIDCGCRDAE